ncbi:MAG TPA: ABC transporter permease [Pyrinomonadaceae bacterium]|nr:ABC transporter permease [Pyrinomonadaceae bacterium]
MGNLLQDIRYGFRRLLKRPGITAIAVVSLGLGIGANTSIFSVVNAVLLRPLPYQDSERLVVLWETNSQQIAVQMNTQNRNQVAPANFLDWNNQNQVFEGMAAIRVLSFNLTGGDLPERVPGAIVTQNLFSLLGVKPALGRSFLPEDAQPNRERVAVLSDGLWQRRFGADPNVIGQKLSLNNELFSVIGVMPREFEYPDDAELWVLSRLEVPEAPGAAKADLLTNRVAHYLFVVARLKPGVTMQQAQAEMKNIGSRLQSQYPDTNGSMGVRVVTMHEEIVGDIKPALQILLGVVFFVLLIACANVANLLLARATSLRKEIAVRIALGANRAHIIRHLLIESVLLALVGGILGLLIAYLGIRLLVTLAPSDIPRLNEINLDTFVLGWTFLISVLTGVIAGLVPALQFSKPNLNETLQEGGRGADAGSSSRRIRGLLVVAEVALTLILLTGAGLLVKSVINLQQVNPGFNPENVLTMRLALPAYKYTGEEQSKAFTTELLHRVKNLPGVDSVAITTALPLSRAEAASSFTVEGQPLPPDGNLPIANWRVVSPEYFQVLSIPLIKGRTFTERDGKDVPSVVIINQTMARSIFPNEDPLARRLVVGGAKSASQIVGVVGDVRHSGLDAEPKPEMYVSYLQTVRPAYTVAVRTEVDPSSIVPSLRNEISAIDKDQPISLVKTMNELRSESLAQLRFNTTALSLFAGIGLILAGVGIYGVMAYSVAQRTHEIGIRMALGAQPENVLKLVLGQGMVLAIIGVGIGLAASLALTRVMASLLFGGVTTTDPMTFAFVSLMLALVALLACYIPARRATRVDPLIALREE